MSASASGNKSSAFRVVVGEREHVVEVIEGSEGEQHVLVDGEPFEVDGAGAHVVRVSPGEAGGGRQIEVSLADGPRPAEAWVEGHRAKLEVRTEQEAQLAAALGKSGAAAGDGSLTAPMPGRVVKVLVTEGETIERGRPAIIIEAMKMENELLATADGVVRSVAVAEGDTVDAGQILCEITVASDEPEAEAAGE
ncbi:hypothetical protein G6O69_13430 [Pseudenhygromyxa sp. WMMC2535]|uniref:biotin/lipoyl-containing protein n=1 Tax=Pseudenhygromyxa sp. WMMC2535 TaxID=2712867 RepID=UPI0015566FCA|nr:biotin/lipoyl-containing protein [Pseudenhygromyxa sp. WMMC2535]NVB38837.1 hypothetical protein [Pseudenhygromyxa sp. WMMC2535]